MGTANSRTLDYKKSYLELLNSRKQAYYKKKLQYIRICNIRLWKAQILTSLGHLQKTFERSIWLKSVLKYTESWESFSINPWRWSVLTYDCIKSVSQFDIETHSTLTNTKTLPESLDSCSYFLGGTLLDLLHKHFEDSRKNYIGGIIKIFNESFHQELMSRILKPSENGGCAGQKDLLTGVFEEIKAFVVLVIQALGCYYGGVVIEKIVEGPNEVFEFILEEVFVEKAHNAILEIFHTAYSEKESVYQKKLGKFNACRCVDMGIAKDFQLDNYSGSQGYNKAISQLKELEVSYGPLKKLAVIHKTSQMICECIDDFWSTQTSLNGKNLLIDSDQVLSIFSYIIIKASIKNLRGHLGIIKEFCKSELNRTSVGYYVATLEACIETIEGLKN